MTRTRRSLAILATATIALILSSCGVDEGDLATDAGTSDPGTVSSTTAADGTTEPDEPDEPAPDQEFSEQEQAAIDITVKTYMDLGMSEEDATCLAEGILGSGQGFDNGDIMDVVNDCDISMETLADLGSGAGSMEDGMKLGLSTSLQNAGLSEEDADCVADAYISEYGTDISAAQDPDKLAPLLDTCGVDPADLSFN